MLFAVWSINSYSLIYIANGGSGAPATATIEFDATATVSSVVPTRDGYTFAGWNTASAGTGTQYASAATFAMPAEDVTLFAQWTAVPITPAPATTPATTPAPSSGGVSGADQIATPAPTTPAVPDVVEPVAADEAPDLVQTGLAALGSLSHAFGLMLLGAALMLMSRRRRRVLG